ncbi:macrophage colony-stimulating factor 1b isoform X2 [Siphateles boraxobius]|uniref:macrophage colony-stimulating factor 1b isoform X2 n=1 Tax=Siphateles boraxobius TaxID=180520 RepID=UPI004063E658
MSQMNNPTLLHFYTTKGKNVCVLILLCVPLSMMDIPGPCKHAITMDHLLQLKQLISNQLRTGCSITYSFIERKHLEDTVAFERQYNETPVQALQRVEEVLSLYLHLITSTNAPVNWTCEQEYNINVPPTETPLTTSTEVVAGLSRQAPQGSSSDDFYRLGFIVVSICGGFLFLLTAYCLLERKKLQRQLHRTRMPSDWGLQVVENFEIQEEAYQTDRRKALGSHLSTAF